MPEPKENPQASIPLQERLDRAIQESRQERQRLAQVTQQARATRIDIRRLLNDRSGERAYERFCIRSRYNTQIVIQGTDRNVLLVSYGGESQEMVRDLEGRYPSSTYTITKQGDTVDVKKKSDGTPIVRAYRSTVPRFMRAIMAYNRVMDGNSLKTQLGWEITGSGVIICGNSTLPVATDGGVEYSLEQYLEEIHRLDVHFGPSLRDPMMIGPRGRNSMEVIVDQHTLNVLRTLRPLAQAASTDAKARRELRDHVHRIDLPQAAYTVLIEEILKPRQLSPDALTAVVACSPVPNTHDAVQRELVNSIRNDIGGSQWIVLEQAGLVYSIPDTSVGSPGRLEVARAGRDVRMIVTGPRGSIDINAEWLTPNGQRIHRGTDYVYDSGIVYVDFPHIQEAESLIYLFHEMGHGIDVESQQLILRIKRLENMLRGSEIVIQRERNLTPHHPLIEQYMLLRREKAVLEQRLELFAWSHALRLSRVTRQRTGYDVIRHRFRSYSQFLRALTHESYHTYFWHEQDLNLDIPAIQFHQDAHDLFVERLFNLDGFEEDIRLYWAEGDIEDIAKLTGTARAEAIKAFNFRYGTFLSSQVDPYGKMISRKFTPFRDCGDGAFLAINGQGTLQTYPNRQAFDTARAGAPPDPLTITNRWWIGFSSAARVATNLEHFHRLNSHARPFTLDSHQLEALERALTVRHWRNITDQIDTLRDELKARNFTPRQIDFLLYGGFFGQNIADHLHATVPDAALHRTIQEVTATATIENFAANQQRLRNHNGEPAFATLLPPQQAAITRAVIIGADMALAVDVRLKRIRDTLAPHFNPPQRELMIMEGHFDRPGEDAIAARARNSPIINLSTIPLPERIWFRGGLDTNNTSMADIVKVAQDLNIDLTNLSDVQKRQKVEENVSILMGRK